MIILANAITAVFGVTAPKENLSGRDDVCTLLATTLVLIGNVTGRNAHIASAGGVYAGSYYLKCTAAVSHTGPPGGQKQNSEARYYSFVRSLARSFVRVSIRVAC